MMNFFFHKKKFRPTSQIGRFPILRPNLRPLSGIEKLFFLKIQLSRIVFGCEIYRELQCRWNHQIIISGSWSKFETTMKNSVFSTFVCDPEVMLEKLQHYGNLRLISPQKHYDKLFFPQKINSVRPPKSVAFRF